MEITFSYAQFQSPKHELQDSICNAASGRLEQVLLMDMARNGVRGGVYRHVGVEGRGGVYAVLDGVGGCRQPKRASQLAADTLGGFVRRTSELDATDQGFRAVWRKANDDVHSLGAEGMDNRPLGAAAGTGLWVPAASERHDDRLTAFVAHAGDTVAWLWNGDTLKEITGTGNAAKVIRNYVGVGPAFEVQVFPVELTTGLEVVVLATDGVTKAMSTKQVEDVVRGRSDVEWIARDVAFNAKHKGSTDDITVMAIQLTDL